MRPGGDGRELQVPKLVVDLETVRPRHGIAHAARRVHRRRELNGDVLDGHEHPDERTRRVEVLEIGFGNGDNLAAQAAMHPQRNYLGVEVHRPGVGRLLLSIEERQLTHVRIICHDAVEVLTHQVASQTLDEVLILFPDPWPKKRHHKRRLVQAPFVELVAERLRVGGMLRFATDWQPYAAAALEVLSGNPDLHNFAQDGTFVPRPTERTPTRFEKRGERLGHDVWDLAFERR